MYLSRIKDGFVNSFIALTAPAHTTVCILPVPRKRNQILVSHFKLRLEKLLIYKVSSICRKSYILIKKWLLLYCVSTSYENILEIAKLNDYSKGSHDSVLTFYKMFSYHVFGQSFNLAISKMFS